MKVVAHRARGTVEVQASGEFTAEELLRLREALETASDEIAPADLRPLDLTGFADEMLRVRQA